MNSNRPTSDDAAPSPPILHSSSIDHAVNTSTTRSSASDQSPASPESPRRPSSIRFSADLSNPPRATASGAAPRTGASTDRCPAYPTVNSPPSSPKYTDSRTLPFGPSSHSSRISIPPLTGPLMNMGNANSQMLDEIVQTSNFDREEVDRLRKRFMKLDKDQSGALDRSEFLSLPSISTNPLATRLIAILDTDGDQTIDFKEFILGLSAFSSKGNKEEKLRFAFKVYDIDRDGYISNGELFLVLKMMVGSNLKDAQLQQICDKTIMEADQDGDGKISFEEFTKVVEGSDVSMSLTLDQF